MNKVIPPKTPTNLPPTHVTTTPNKRPLTDIEVLSGNMMNQEFMNAVTAYYRGNKDEALAFKMAAVDYVRKVPALLKCDRASLLLAFVTAASFRFMPSGVSGEMYIIPYGKEAKPQMGYQGIITLLWRTGKIKSISAMIVYDNEHFEYTEGLDTHLQHVPTKFGEKKGEPIGVYTVAHTTTGGKLFKVMSKEDIMDIKNLSKAKNSSESPWNSKKDPEMWMWKKTCLIQMAKFLPKTMELQRAIEIDNDGEGISKTPIDAGGPAVGRAFHGNEENQDAGTIEEPIVNLDEDNFEPPENPDEE